MSEIKLYRIGRQGVQPLPSWSVALEKPLQRLIEENLETLLGVTFVKSEHITSKDHGGRIDTLGLDENNCPVVIEYKRSRDENVVNQGLSYLNWLMNNRAEFTLMVAKKFGEEVAAAIEWNWPRVLYFAGDFFIHDQHAIHESARSNELIRHRRFGEGMGDDLLLFEL